MKVSLTTRKGKPNMIRATPKRWKKKRDPPPPPPPSPPQTEADEDDTPISSIACLNNFNDIERFEESEDCFILGFDPSNSDNNTTPNPNPTPLDAAAAQNPNANDDDIQVVAEKGQVACRDFPHPRHECVKYPFGTSSVLHARHCELCFCFICDSPAPCEYWTSHLHCSAYNNSWYSDIRKMQKAGKVIFTT